MLTSSTLRPGLLVSLKTSVTGNVSYNRRDIEATHRTADGSEQARWETERTVTDPVEFEKAGVARAKLSALVRGVCAKSAFGLLCPEADAEKLEQAIADARRVADNFNAEATFSRVSVFVITGRIAPDDVEAVRAINSEVRDLLQDMETGVANLDVKSIREAANRAKQLGSMLTPDAEARIQIAIETARKAAGTITKAGEQAAIEIDQSAIRKISEARTAFLDLDPAKEAAVPTMDARTLDLTPSVPIATVAVQSPAIDME